MRVKKKTLNDALRILGKVVCQTSPVELYRSIRFVGADSVLVLDCLLTDGFDLFGSSVLGDDGPLAHAMIVIVVDVEAIVESVAATSDRHTIPLLVPFGYTWIGREGYRVLLAAKSAQKQHKIGSGGRNRTYGLQVMSLLF